MIWTVDLNLLLHSSVLNSLISEEFTVCFNSFSNKYKVECFLLEVWMKLFELSSINRTI